MTHRSHSSTEDIGSPFTPRRMVRATLEAGRRETECVRQWFRAVRAVKGRGSNPGLSLTALAVVLLEYNCFTTLCWFPLCTQRIRCVHAGLRSLLSLLPTTANPVKPSFLRYSAASYQLAILHTVVCVRHR